MITIGSPHSASDPGSESVSRPAQPDDPERVSKKKLPLMAIPITLSVGLLVAAGYVGHRIVSAKTHPVAKAARVPASATPVKTTPVAARAAAQAGQAPPTSAVPSAVSPVAALPAPPAAIAQRIQSKPVDSPAVKAEAPPQPIESGAGSNNGLIDPQRGQRYLQIAAISSGAVDWFMADLRRNHMQVRLAPGPREGLVRVLIGPFPDWDSLYTVKAQIQRMWPDAFVRAY